MKKQKKATFLEFKARNRSPYVLFAKLSGRGIRKIDWVFCPLTIASHKSGVKFVKKLYIV